MKILHTVESYDPTSHGMQQVVKQLSERLIKLGHEVTVATSYHPNRENLLINGVKIEEFEISGKAIGGYQAGENEIQRYRDFLLNSEFDVITNFAAQQWATDIALPILNKIKAAKVFVPTGFSELANIKFNDYFDSMKIWMKEYDMNVFLSKDYQDIDFARENCVKNIKVIPNGASAEEFVEKPSINIRKELGIPENHSLILHVGSHTGLKGHKEAVKIFKKAKIVNATLLLVGNTTHSIGEMNHLLKFSIKSIANLFSFFSGKKFFPSCSFSCKLDEQWFKYSYAHKLQNKLFFVKNLSREQTVAAYMASDLFLFPSNIECSPLVLFECMASKTPFLTTDVGNSKEIISWSNSGTLLPTLELKDGLRIADINKSANILEELISNKKAVKEKAILGFKAFTNNYSWDKISKEYEQLYFRLQLKND